MKSYNKYLNLLNLVTGILIGIIFHMCEIGFESLVYKCFARILIVIPMLIIVFNVIMTIVDFIKKNRMIAVLNFLMGVGWFLFFFMDGSEIIQMISIAVVVILSVINLIINRKKEENKKCEFPMIIFIIFMIVESAMIVLPIILNIMNFNNLEKALIKLENEENIETYLYKENNDYVFINKDGKEIAKKRYDDFIVGGSDGEPGFKRITIKNKIIDIGIARIGKRISIINSQGEELFALYNVVDEDYYEVGLDFLFRAMSLKGWDLRFAGIKRYTEKNNNVLREYNENNIIFEENKEDEYMYFKNPDIMDKVLQVVIKQDKLNEDVNLLENNEETDYNDEETENLVTIKKEYYLLDFEEETKIPLECNNLIFENYYDEEDEEERKNILLYSNGTIPFFDVNETGYFKKDGEKVVADKGYIIENINDKYIIQKEKETKKTEVKLIETGEVVKQFKNKLLIYEKFYIECPEEEKYKKEYEDMEYILMDSDFNVLAESKEQPKFFDNNLMVISDKKDFIYHYDGDKFELIAKGMKFKNINSYKQADKKYGESVYSKLNKDSDF